jgi:hypothetical protein
VCKGDPIGMATQPAVCEIGPVGTILHSVGCGAIPEDQLYTHEGHCCQVLTSLSTYPARSSVF